MLLSKFRIQNFRSIEDSGWTPLSEDGVSVVVGMNESGKTSLLEALDCTIGDATIEPRDFRFGRPQPEIFLEFQLTQDEVASLVKGWPATQAKLVTDYFKASNNRYQVRFYWIKEEGEFKGYADSLLDELFQQLAKSREGINRAVTTIAVVSAALNKEPTPSLDQLAEQFPDFEEALEKRLRDQEPSMVLFSDNSGLLPDSIDVTNEFKLKGSGYIGARNFLTVAQIDLQKLVEGTDIERVNLLKRATKQITRDFGEFWSQNIGNGTQLELECEILSKRESTGEDRGKPYLSFWITDGVNRLHPSQRSKGLSWFLSFYLQLRASELRQRRTIFLLDEPGANLHEKAQGDVIKLINKISQSLAGLIYSTHSPHLIEPTRLHRILTVERANDSDESPSIIRNVLRDASSCSSDTLSPIYTKMGVDFWRQTVIERTNNVLLEEPSGFFYLRAFWLLTKSSKRASFIACTGVNNIPQLAYMFSGWGLGFVVVVDDENSGRGVYKELQKNLFGGDEDRARKTLLKLKGYEGIEDIFTIDSFQKNILRSANENYPERNTEYLRKNNLSKPLLACRFFLAVERGEITMESLDEATQKHIEEIVNSIEALLP